MKKLIYLIVLALILGLVFTGCLLFNVGQVPITDQSGINGIEKNGPPLSSICIDFESTSLVEGDLIEGEGMVDSLLNINLEGVDLILIKEETTNGEYVAYGANKTNQNDTDNGCLNGDYGFGGSASEDRIKSGDKIVFTFLEGVTVSYFSVMMFDYGDWYPSGTGNPQIKLTDNNGNSKIYDFPLLTSLDYDACSSTGKGKVKLEISGSGINEVTLEFVGKTDSGVGFDDICFTTIEVPVDIKPTSCPNPINTKSNGVTPVAILGTLDFDVTQINPVTVTLAGASPLRWDWEDVATPFEPYTGKEDCDLDCNTLGPDGYLDLTLKFNTQELLDYIGTVESFEVNEEELNTLESGVDDQVTTITGETLSVGDCLVIQLEGLLLDGTPIIGEDVVRILEKGKK